MLLLHGHPYSGPPYPLLKYSLDDNVASGNLSESITMTLAAGKYIVGVDAYTVNGSSAEYDLCVKGPDTIHEQDDTDFLASYLPDFNNDNRTDLLWERISTGSNYVTLMNSAVHGAFLYIKDSKDPDLAIVDTGDFNGDGKSDLIWERASTGAHYITLMLDGCVHGPFNYIPDSKDTDLVILGTGDFNGDGKDDLLWERLTNGANYVTLINNGVRGAFQYITDSKNADLAIVGIGKFNSGDIKADLLWERASTGAVYITLMNGAAHGAFQYIPDSKDTDLAIVGLGDFDGDADDDLLWERLSNGANYVTLINNGVRGAFQYITDSKNADLAIVGIGDFNGDNKADLLWERASTGANYITLMNGAAHGPFQYITDSKDTGLEIIEP